jgi:hypothetical protein
MVTERARPLRNRKRMVISAQRVASFVVFHW